MRTTLTLEGDGGARQGTAGRHALSWLLDANALIALAWPTHASHRLLPMDFGFEQVLGCCSGGRLGHRQITDAYLLSTATRHHARLLTFDSGIRQLLAAEPEREQLLHILK